MASKQPPYSETNSINQKKSAVDKGTDQNNAAVAGEAGGRPVSCQLHLRSTSVDRKVVLRRIKQRKVINKIKSAFQHMVDDPYRNQHMFDGPYRSRIELEDAFSAP